MVPGWTRHEDRKGRKGQGFRMVNGMPFEMTSPSPSPAPLGLSATNMGSSSSLSSFVDPLNRSASSVSFYGDGQRYSKAKQKLDREERVTPLPFGESNGLPTFLAHDRMVLCFHAFFREAVNESAAESFRVRKVRESRWPGAFLLHVRVRAFVSFCFGPQ
jgi:hypothetical protein